MKKKPLELHERARILKLRTNGMSILAISKEIHRSKRIVSAFLKDPVHYLKPTSNSAVKIENDKDNSDSSSSVPYDNLLNETSTPPTANKQNNNQTIKTEKSTTNNSTKSAPSSSSSSSTSVPASTSSPSSAVNKVTFEHRSIIKFLTKKGWNAIAIHDDMKHVYKSSAPSLPSIEYWVNECTINPSINFNRIVNKSPQKKKSKPKRLGVEKVKTILTNAAKQITNNSSKDKDKNDKNSGAASSSSSSTNKNLLIFKLFDNSAKNNKKDE